MEMRVPIKKILVDLIVWVCAFSKVFSQTMLLWLHTRLPTKREEIKTMMFEPYRKLGIQGLDEDQQMESFFTLSCVIERTKIVYIHDRGNAVKEGGDALNTSVHRMDGLTVRLLDYMKTDRPLVLNFGSCT